MRLIPPPRSPDVFAVGTTQAQISWHGAREGVRVEGPDGIAITSPLVGGVVTLGNLAPDTRTMVRVQAGSAHRELAVETLRPPGPETARFATMNDLHLGSRGFGATRRIRDPKLGHHMPLRCAQAAFADAVDWGAEFIVLKGDLVHRATAEEWAQLRELVDAAPVPVYLTRGNHESHGERCRATDEWFPKLTSGEHDRVEVLEVTGLRIVLVDTTVRGRHRGQIEPLAESLCAAVSGDDPALVLHHHHLGELPFPTHYPKGIHGAEVTRTLRRVRAVNPNVVFASGHSHRHRRRTRQGFTMAELGSTSDHPGTWCGYTAHRDGLVQTVWRISDPDVCAWSHRAGRAVLGLWSHWAPGRLGDRCFVVEWN